ncbi:MAG: zinc-binding alcohol dehydrogenase [Bacteroidota bacterium]
MTQINFTTALWHQSDQTSVLKKAPFHTNEKDTVTVKSLYSLISTGTERLVATGKVPKELHETMQVQAMEGDFSFPVKYGYSVVGEVLSEGNLQGQRVHLMHPHQDYLSVSPTILSVVPKEVPPKRASLASNVETALNAVWDSQVSVGDRVVVVGFGMIGGLVARVLSLLPAVEVFVCEQNPFRAALAKEMGFSVATEAPQNCDVSFHTTSSAEGLQAAIEAVGMEGKIVELSWYGTREVSLQLGGSFHQQRKQIISSQVGQIPSNKSARWDYGRRKKVVWKLLKNPLFDAHITHEVPFPKSPIFFQKLRTGGLEKDGLGWVIRY